MTQGTFASNGIAREVELLEQRVARLNEDATSLSCVGADLLDRAAVVEEQDRILALRTIEEDKLGQARRAKEWHENGHRGLCEDCLQPINPKRLVIVPSATRCVDCEKKRERGRRRLRTRYWR